jgi:hypothetical protein
MNQPTIAETFETYRQSVIPADAPSIKVEECRRAFYAGSYGMLMNFANIGDDTMSEDDGVAYLERLRAECETFAANIKHTPIEPARPTVEQHSYNVRSRDVESALRDIATQIRPQVPDGFGFTLLIFSYGRTGLRGEGPAGSMFYISSAQRDDMVKAMREFIQRNMQ